MIESKWSYVCRSNMGAISRCAPLSIISNAAVQTALNEWSELVTNSTRIQWTRCWQSYLLRALLALVVLLYEVIACELKLFEFVWKLLLFRYANNQKCAHLYYYTISAQQSINQLCFSITSWQWLWAHFNIHSKIATYFVSSLRNISIWSFFRDVKEKSHVFTSRNLKNVCIDTLGVDPFVLPTLSVKQKRLQRLQTSSFQPVVTTLNGREPFLEMSRVDILCTHTQLCYIFFIRVLNGNRWLIVGCYNGSMYKLGWKPLL